MNVGIGLADGIITSGGLATGTVVEGLVKGGNEIGITATEVGSNILGTVGEGAGGLMNGVAETLGIPTPGQVAGGVSNMMLIGGVLILAFLVLGRGGGGGGGNRPPQIVMLPGGQVAAI
jgi:hypothetical protein